MEQLRLAPRRGGADEAPRGSAAMRSAPPARSAHRAGPRAADGTRCASPRAGSVGMSFSEWTARSIAPASSASSISLVKRPLPPIIGERPCGHAVAGGADGHESRSRRARRVPACAAASRAFTSAACASANGLPRVPRRKVGEAMPRSRGRTAVFQSSSCPRRRASRARFPVQTALDSGLRGE